MKKRWFLPLAVGALALVWVTATGTETEQAVTVRTALLKPQRVEQTVSCSGVVEAGETQGVFASLTCVVDEVLVEEGQQVKAGEPIISIDKEATKLVQQSGDRISGALSLLTMDSVVCAPADGIVLSVETATGEILYEQTPCITFVPQSALQIKVSIREKALPSLAVGQAARVSGVGFDREVYSGELTEIASLASASSNGEAVVEGIVTLDENEADDSMRLGLTAKAKFITSVAEECLVIPHEAVCREEENSYYAYFFENGTAVRRSIDVSTELSNGLLLATNEYIGCAVILDPELVSVDGMSVRQEAVE